MEEFLNDEEKNIHNFQLKEYLDGVYLFSIEDSFEFSIEKDLTVSSKEEFLEPFIQNLNKNKYKSIAELLNLCNEEYEKLILDDVSHDELGEIEEEESDFKFVARLKFDPKVIKNFDFSLFIYIFEFIEPFEFVKFSRISKKFHQIVNNEKLWRFFCEKEGIKKRESGWKITFIHEYKRKELNFKSLLQSDVSQRKVEKFENYITYLNSAKIQIRFPNGQKEIYSLSKWTPMSVIYEMIHNKLTPQEKSRPYKIMFLNQKIVNDKSTLEELKISNCSLSIGYEFDPESFVNSIIEK